MAEIKLVTVWNKECKRVGGLTTKGWEETLGAQRKYSFYILVGVGLHYISKHLSTKHLSKHLSTNQTE